uniref:Uncharacterized protein n=1 Tax=viral metagenome TaxID=1070528 RepID=A0A6C0D985_9ZZZZ
MKCINTFDNKIVNIYKSGVDSAGGPAYTNFGFNVTNPVFTVDVKSNVNVTDDYYIRGYPFYQLVLFYLLEVPQL